jgi:hypothetical protein
MKKEHRECSFFLSKLKKFRFFLHISKKSSNFACKIVLTNKQKL